MDPAVWSRDNCFRSTGPKSHTCHQPYSKFTKLNHSVNQNTFMQRNIAQTNGLFCTDVPLRNYSLTQANE